jgi:Flp pilus assembly protein TadB
MSSEEARQIVADGLERRKEEQCLRDAEMDRQERMLRLTINGNHTERTLSEAQKKEQEKEKARQRRAAKEKARRDRAARDMAAEMAVNQYGIVCLLCILVSCIFHLNFFVFLALVLGLAVFPVAKIYKLYVMMEEIEK